MRGGPLQITTQAGEIENGLRAALDKIVPDLRYGSYVIDLLWRTAQEGGVQVIEVNPFLAATDACLFSWRAGGDFDNPFRYCP